MRNLRLLSTTAAVLLLGVGAVSAQTTKSDEAPGGAPAAHQNVPAKKVAPAKVAPTLKSSQRKAPETTGQAAPTAPESDKTQLKSQTMDKGAPADAASKHSSDEHSPSTTTGQGAASASAKLSPEQSTKITAIIRQHKVAPVRLNVSVRVGTRVPNSVHFYRLPQQVYGIYPEWRGYDYIMVGNEIIVLDPRSHEIVAILQA